MCTQACPPSAREGCRQGRICPLRTSPPLYRLDPPPVTAEQAFDWTVVARWLLLVLALFFVCGLAGVVAGYFFNR